MKELGSHHKDHITRVHQQLETIQEMNEKLSPTIHGTNLCKSPKQFAKDQAKAKKCQIKNNVLHEIIDAFPYPKWMMDPNVPLPAIPLVAPPDQPPAAANNVDLSSEDQDDEEESEDHHDEDWNQASDDSDREDGTLADAVVPRTNTNPIILD